MKKLMSFSLFAFLMMMVAVRPAQASPRVAHSATFSVVSTGGPGHGRGGYHSGGRGGYGFRGNMGYHGGFGYRGGYGYRGYYAPGFAVPMPIVPAPYFGYGYYPRPRFYRPGVRMRMW